MVATPCLLVQINDRIVPLLEVGHGSLPTVMGSREDRLPGRTDGGDEWGYASFRLLSRLLAQRVRIKGTIIA